MKPPRSMLHIHVRSNAAPQIIACDLTWNFLASARISLEPPPTSCLVAHGGGNIVQTNPRFRQLCIPAYELQRNMTTYRTDVQHRYRHQASRWKSGSVADAAESEFREPVSGNASSEWSSKSEKKIILRLLLLSCFRADATTENCQHPRRTEANMSDR